MRKNYPKYYYCKICGVQIMRPMGSSDKIVESDNDLGICKNCKLKEVRK